MKNNALITIIIILAVGVACFYGGIQYQKNSMKPSKFGQFQNMPARDGNQRRVGGPVSGEILSIDEKTMTVKMQDGSSKIVVYSSSTKVNKNTEGSISDLSVGEQVMVMGTETSDGTIIAQILSVGTNAFSKMGDAQTPEQSN
jgi:hypothetical protein